MALQLRCNLTRFVNPNRKPYLLNSLSTSAPDPFDDQICRKHLVAPSSVNYLRKLVDKLLTFDDDVEKNEKGKEEEEDGGGGVSVRKRMLEKMRNEWKASRDGDGWRTGESVELKLGEVKDAENKVWSEGDVSFLELEENVVRKRSYKVVEEGMNGSTEEKESRCWKHELGELVEGEQPDDENLKLPNNLDLVMGISNDGVQELRRLGNAKEKRERFKEKGRKNSAQRDLDDTLQMLKTTKKKLLGKEVNLKDLTLLLKSTNLDDKRNISFGSTKGVINEELKDTLKKLQKDLEGEKEQLRLYRDKVLNDCIEKLDSVRIKEEEHIRSIFDEALRKSIQKLQQEVRDKEIFIKTSLNHFLMVSYSKMHKRFQKEKKCLVSSYAIDSTNSS